MTTRIQKPPMPLGTRQLTQTAVKELKSPAGLPTLQSGDRLSRTEFVARYEAMPHLKKAELIKGVVYVGSPVAIEHGEAHPDLVLWLGYYRAFTPGVRTADNATMRLDDESEPQPDALLRILPTHGGQSRLSSDMYIEGAVELVAEVAVTSANYDLYDKRDVYLEHSVREYIVWRVWDEAIDWFVLREGKYERNAPGLDGIIRSEVFPGLWLDAAAMIRGDMTRVLEFAQMGVASPEHAAFVETLNRAAQPKP